MKRAAAAALRKAAVTLRRAKADFKEATTPQPSIPGLERPFLIDMKRWEAMETADIKFAFKLAWAEYVKSWDGEFDERATGD
jgi:hypothetical protein